MSKKQILRKTLLGGSRSSRLAGGCSAVLIAALTALGAAIGLNSCNVVRTISNKSEFYQRGDTSCTIVTKTIESYDAKKNLNIY